MVMIIIPASVIESRRMPIEVQNFIAPQLWNQIIESLKLADEESNSCACLLECGICLVFAFPCIFCCHGCIAGAFSESTRTKKLNQMNRIYFYGRPVLSATEQGGLLINTDFISSASLSAFSNQSMAQPSMQPTAQSAYSAQPAPAMAYAEHSTQTNPLQHKELYGNNGNGGAAAVPVAVSVADNVVRSMAVTVPAGAGPGTVLTVSTPEGMVVNVTVPQGTYGGQRIEVQY